MVLVGHWNACVCDRLCGAILSFGAVSQVAELTSVIRRVAEQRQSGDGLPRARRGIQVSEQCRSGLGMALGVTKRGPGSLGSDSIDCRDLPARKDSASLRYAPRTVEC